MKEKKEDREVEKFNILSNLSNLSTTIGYISGIIAAIRQIFDSAEGNTILSNILDVLLVIIYFLGKVPFILFLIGLLTVLLWDIFESIGNFEVDKIIPPPLFFFIVFSFSTLSVIYFLNRLADFNLVNYLIRTPDFQENKWDSIWCLAGFLLIIRLIQKRSFLPATDNKS